MSATVTLNGVPTEDAAIGYTLPPGSIAYGQTWQVSPDGAHWTDIPGAHGATFAPGDAEAGKLLRVLVNFDDAALNQRHEASDGQRVANIDDEPQGGLSITGGAVQGATLGLAGTVTDADGMSDPGRDYEWQVQDGNGDWGTLPGGRGPSFALTQAEVGRVVRAVMSYVDDHGSREWVVAGPTAAVANVNDAPRGGVAVAGTARQGEVLSLTDTVTDADGWPGFPGVARLFADADPSAMSIWDDGQPLELGVRFTATSAGTVTGLRFYKVPGDTSPHAGHLWTATGTLLAEAAFADETASGWQQVDLAAPIRLAAGAEYVASYHREGGAFPYTPFFFGTAHSNGPLTAPAGANGVYLHTPSGFPTESWHNENYWVDVVFDARPRATGTGGFDGFGGAPFTYQWQVEGDGGAWADVAGAAGASFAPTEAEVGRSVRAVFRYTDGHGTAEAVASAATAAVENANDAPTGVLGIGGDLRQGETLAVADGVADADGVPAGARAYHWHRETDGGGWMDIPGATDATYTLTEADVGRRMQAVLIYTDARGAVERVETAATAPVENANDGPGGNLAIVGAARQGAALSMADAVTDADGMLNAVREYQWQVRDGAGDWTDIPGATAAAFTPTQAEVGRSVRGVLVYRDDRGQWETPATDGTALVENVNDYPVGALVVAGAARQGETLTATAGGVTDADGMLNAAPAWHWQFRDGQGGWTDIVGSAGADFTPTQSLVGRAVRAVLSYTDDLGMAETVASAPTLAVADAAFAPFGSLTVVGTPRQGETLSLIDAVNDGDGIPDGARSYKWQAEDGQGGWADIAGAASETFAPTQAQVGRAVRGVVLYTDGDGAPQGFAGAPSAAVANVNDAPTGAIALTGRPVRGGTVTASAAALADADGMGAVSLRWERGDGGAWTALPGATGPDYAPGAADVGRVLRVMAAWTDGHGTPETASAETGIVAPRAIALPPPGDGAGGRDPVADRWTSADLAGMTADGGALVPPPGAEVVRLADGVLCFGTGTTEAFVSRLYLGLLGRAGDVEGLAAFAERGTDGGASRADLARAVLSSAEYGARHGGAPRTDAGFVEDLYGAFLGRPGDATELGSWTAALERGASRAEVAAAIAGSAEAGAHMQASTAGVFVADVEAIQARGFYRCALGREADAAGLRHLSDALDRGADARTLGGGLERSAEFQARHGGGMDQAFVEALYRDGMGRQADAAGLGHWAGLLESGHVGRGELALSFAATPEARGHLDWPL